MSYKDYLSEKSLEINIPEVPESITKEDNRGLFSELLDVLIAKSRSVYDRLVSMAMDDSELIDWLENNKEVIGVALNAIRPFVRNNNVEIESVKLRFRATLMSEGIFDVLRDAPRNVLMMTMLLVKLASVDNEVLAGNPDEVFDNLISNGKKISDIVVDKYDDMKDKMSDHDIPDSDEIKDRIKDKYDDTKGRVDSLKTKFKDDVDRATGDVIKKSFDSAIDAMGRGIEKNLNTDVDDNSEEEKGIESRLKKKLKPDLSNPNHI